MVKRYFKKQRKSNSPQAEIEITAVTADPLLIETEDKFSEKQIETPFEEEWNLEDDNNHIMI